jgi:hypothetical protein
MSGMGGGKVVVLVVVVHVMVMKSMASNKFRGTQCRL